MNKQLYEFVKASEELPEDKRQPNGTPKIIILRRNYPDGYIQYNTRTPNEIADFFKSGVDSKDNWEWLKPVTAQPLNNEVLKDFFHAGFDFRSSLLPEIIEEYGENCSPDFKEYLEKFEKENVKQTDGWIGDEELLKVMWDYGNHCAASGQHGIELIKPQDWIKMYNKSITK